MVTVEVDPARVESRLTSGEIGCPSCPSGVLAAWGYARVRRIVGVAAAIRPRRRSRCGMCSVTHLLLPVSLLLRRAYLAEVIFSALEAKAGGLGHRRIAARVSVPEATVRGWIRVVVRQAGAVRNWFLAIAVSVGVDVSIPKATGSRCGDVVAAIDAARAAVAGRFGGAVTAAAVAAGCSGGRLLAPGWPPGGGVGSPTPVASVAAMAGAGSSDVTSLTT